MPWQTYAENATHRVEWFTNNTTGASEGFRVYDTTTTPETLLAAVFIGSGSAFWFAMETSRQNLDPSTY